MSLERNVLKIIKTVITHNQGQEDEFVETLDHVKMRPVIKDLSDAIKKFKKYNKIFYKKNEKSENTDELLQIINTSILDLEKHYHNLSNMINLKEFFMRRCNKKMKDLLDTYPERFSRHL